MAPKQPGHYDQEQHAGTPQHGTRQHGTPEHMPQHTLLTGSPKDQDLHGDAVSFTDLPQPFFKALVDKLRPYCYNLFRSCKGLAAAVAHHSTGLTLTPDKTLQSNSNRRRFVLALASNSNNIRLQLEQQAIPLDVAAVWPCVKQLTLSRLSFTPTTLSNLHPEQLTQLHTCALINGWVTPPNNTLNVSALRRLLQLGALPNLRTLTCMDMDRHEAFQALQQLGVVLGQRVTELVVDQVMALTQIKLWPGLQRLQLKPSFGFSPDAHLTAVQQVFEHPQVKEAALTSDMFMGSLKINDSAEKLDCLHLTDPAGPDFIHLQSVPLQAVKRLRIHMGVMSVVPISAASASHLRQCTSVEVLPIRWAQNNDRYEMEYDGLPSDTPTWEMSFDPVLLEWLLPNLSKAEGALILHGHMEHLLSTSHAASLSLLPPKIHTLALDSCAMDGGLTWAQLIAQVPQQVRFLLVRYCNITQAQFEAVLAELPPAGLCTISLAQDRHYMPWVKQHAAAVEALVASKWPSVKVDLVLSENLEDIWEDKRARDLSMYSDPGTSGTMDDVDYDDDDYDADYGFGLDNAY